MKRINLMDAARLRTELQALKDAQKRLYPTLAEEQALRELKAKYRDQMPKSATPNTEVRDPHA